MKMPGEGMQEGSLGPLCKQAGNRNIGLKMEQELD